MYISIKCAKECKLCANVLDFYVRKRKKKKNASTFWLPAYLKIRIDDAVCLYQETFSFNKSFNAKISIKCVDIESDYLSICERLI